jgi:hypothetical protein
VQHDNHGVSAVHRQLQSRFLFLDPGRSGVLYHAERPVRDQRRYWLPTDQSAAATAATDVAAAAAARPDLAKGMLDGLLPRRGCGDARL